MPIYIADYRADTTRFSTEQHGAYLLIMLDYWRNGPPPDDDAVLARIVALSVARWKTHRLVISQKFQIVKGQWIHKRIEQELSKARGKQAAMSDNGKLGAVGKWGEVSDAKMTRSERLSAARAIATHTEEEWQALLDVCGDECGRCGAGDNLVKDHVQPIYQGGSDGIENLQPICRSCNSSKGPEVKDFRPNDWRKRLQERLRERLEKRLANACQTPAPSPSPSPSPSPTHKDLPSPPPAPPPSPEVKNSRNAVALPDWLPAEWQEFEQHRREKRQTLTPTALRGCIRKLERWRNEGHDIVAILRHAIDNGYTGLFEPGNGNGAGRQSLQSNNIAAAREFVRRGEVEDDHAEPTS
jgi:uncharacterized protein YdaU (DUF1376 family)